MVKVALVSSKFSNSPRTIVVAVAVVDLFYFEVLNLSSNFAKK